MYIQYLPGTDDIHYEAYLGFVNHLCLYKVLLCTKSYFVCLCYADHVGCWFTKVPRDVHVSTNL